MTLLDDVKAALKPFAEAASDIDVFGIIDYKLGVSNLDLQRARAVLARLDALGGEATIVPCESAEDSGTTSTGVHSVYSP